MAEVSPAEEAPFGATLKEEEFSLDNPEELLPKTYQEIPLSAPPTSISETITSDMADSVSYDDVKFKADLEEQKRRNRAIQASIFGTPSTAAVSLDAIRTIVNTPPTKRTKGEAVASIIARSLDKPTRAALAGGLDVADGQQLTKAGVEKTLGMAPGSFEAGMSASNSAAKSIAQHFKGKDGWDQVDSLTDLIAFANPIGGADAEGMDIEFWDVVKDVVSLDFDADDFEKRMVSNWGEDWEWKWTSWLVKEAVVDTALLTVAITMTPLAGIMAFTQAGLKANMVASVARTALISFGGTGVQAAQNSLVLDRETDYEGEILGRALGQGVFEVLGHGVKAGFRAWRGSKAKELGSKPLTEEQLKAALSPDAEISAHSSMTRAQLDGEIKKYNAVTHELADNVADSTLSPDIRRGVAAHLGIDESQLKNIRTDMVLPLFKDENKTLLKKSFIVPLIERQGSEYTAIKELQGIYMQEKTVGLRATASNISSSSIDFMNTIFKKLGIAEASKLAHQSGSNWLTTKNFTAKQTQGFRKMYGEVEKGLSKREKEQLGAIAKEGDAAETVWDFTNISPSQQGGKAISPKVQAAYRKFRYVNDLAYEVADEGMTRVLKDSVFRFKGKHVQIDKSARSLDSYKPNEDIMVHHFDPNTLSVTESKAFPIKARTLQKDINQIETIIPYRVGHVPRVYRDQRFSVVVLDHSGGKIAYEATFDSNHQATKYALKREAIARERGSKEVVVKLWNKIDSGAAGVHMTRGSAKLMSQVDEPTREIFKRALMASGIKEHQVRVALDKMITPATSKGLKERKIGVATAKGSHKARLELAENPKSKDAQDKFARLVHEETPMTKDSMLNYYSSVAQNAGYDNWRKFAVDDWVMRYGHLIDGTPDPLNFLKKTDYRPAPSLSNTKWNKEVAEAVDYAKWLNRTMKDRTWVESKLDDMLISISDNIALKAAQGSISMRALSKIMDSVPLAKELENTLRFVAAFPKLLTLNTAQIVVQGSQAALGGGAAFGYSPRLAMMSLWKLGKITGLEAARGLKIRAPKAANINSARQVHKEMIESGYFADLQTTDTAFGMRHGRDPGSGRKMWEFTKAAGAVPFRIGEALNRSVAYVTTRDQIANAVQKVANKGIDNVSKTIQRLAKDFDGNVMTPADIGGHAFREAAVEKASIVALNMGKAGELQITSGMGSVGLQFKQVLAKELSVIDSSALTLREKVFGAGAMLTFFGAGAIPLAGDVLNLADYFASDADKPADRLYFQDQARAFNKMLGDNLESFTDGFISTEGAQRFFKKGAFTAATDGELDFANRVALGNFMTETWDVQDGWDIVVSMAVLRDFAQATQAVTGLGWGVLNPLSYLEVLMRVKDGDTIKDIFLDKVDPESVAAQYLNSDVKLDNALASVLRHGGKIFTRAGSISRLYDAAHRDVVAPEAHWRNPYAAEMYSTSGLRGVPVERTRARDLMFKWGITPGKIVEQYSKARTERIYSEAIKEFGYDLERKYRAALGAPKLQNRIAEEAIDQMIMFRKHMQDMGLDVPVTANAMKSVFGKLNRVILNIQTGGR